MNRILGFVMWVGVVAGLRAEVSPLDTALPEEQETLIACEWAVTNKVPKLPGPDPAPGTYHYKVWIPKGYHAETNRSWPCLFISSPTGNANMIQYGARMKRDGWLVVMLVEAKNGPWEPILANFLAAHDDAVKRLRIQEGLKFASGTSGGARASSIYVQVRPGFGGVFLQAAGFGQFTPNGGYYLAEIPKTKPFVVTGSFGYQDQNWSEMRDVNAQLPASTRRLLVPFCGGHNMTPEAMCERMWDWVERQLYAELPTQPAWKDQYACFFERQASRRAEWTSLPVQYRNLETLALCAKNRGLGSQTRLASLVREVESEFSKLKMSRAMSQELAAMDAYAKQEEAEFKAWLGLCQRADSKEQIATRTAKLDPMWRKFGKDWQKLAEKFPGTETAKEASRRAADYEALNWRG